MRVVHTLLVVATCLSSLVLAATGDAGIFADDGSVQQPEGVRPFGVAATPRATAVDPNRPDTNAERMRLGLPLLPPKRRLDFSTDPEHIIERAVHVPEARACIDASRGVISVTRVVNNQLQGYIRRTYDAQNSYTFGIRDDAVTVAGPNVTDGTAVDILALNGPDTAYPRIGAVGGNGGYNFNPGQVGYAYLSGTGKTNLNSPPSFTAGHSIQALAYNGPAESQIWKVACDGSITAQWTNVDGSQPATRVMYDETVDTLALVGDLDAFVSAFPTENVFLVTLKLEPTSAI